MQKKFLFFIFLFFNIYVLSAQTPEAAQAAHIAQVAFDNLKNDGWLVVKLPTTSKKLENLNAQVAKGNNSTRLALLIEEETDWLRTLQEDLVSGFKTYYTFSKVICVYDTSYKELVKNPNVKGVFYNIYLINQPDFTLADKAFLTFRLDLIAYQTLYKQGFVVTDSAGNILPSPFPYDYPIKFRHLPITNSNPKVDFIGLGIHRKSSKTMYCKRRYNWKGVNNENPCHAIVSMLQLRLEFADEFGL